MPPKLERQKQLESPPTLFPDLQACPSWIPDPTHTKSDLSLAELPNESESLDLDPGDASLIKIAIEASQLPPVTITPTLLSKLKFSTRSCLAQSGAFLSLPSGHCLSPKQTEALSHGKKIVTHAILNNYGPSRLTFQTGDRLARAFHTNPKDCLSLEEVCKFSSLGYIEGQEGVDYHVGVEEDGTAFLALRVSPTEYHLPSRKTLRISSRNDLYKHLTPGTPGRRQHPFHLVESTAKVNLPDNILGLLSPELDPPTAIHLPSHLIDPGTSWKIRLEVYGEILPATTASWVRLTLHKSPLLIYSIKNNQSTYSACLVSSPSAC